MDILIKRSPGEDDSGSLVIHRSIPSKNTGHATLIATHNFSGTSI